MPRSPLSPPVGKRMRTMEDSDDSDDEIINYMRSQGYRDCLMREDEFHGQGDDDDDDEEEEDEDGGEDDDEEDLEGDVDDDDDDDDDDDELDGDEINYSSDSLSSGYAGLNDHQGYDEDDEEDFVGYDSEDEDEIDHCLPDEYLKHDPTPETQYPPPKWITIKELRQRKYGLPSTGHSRQASMYWFERHTNNSLWMIQRLELSKRLEEHTGHVNCLNFNSTGNLLCSGGDDLAICIWDWQLNKLKKKVNSGHINNIFYSEFCNSDANIITTSRDGTVRLVNVETSQSEFLMSQNGEIGKLAFITPQTLVTCSTNACVNFIDLRIREPTKLFIVRNPSNNRSCALYSINSHPLDKHKIVVAGASPYVFLYDLRRVARNRNDVEHKPTYCLDNFENTHNIVTSTAFNSNGDKLLISYNDDDLFVCQTDTCEIIHRYKGHRNKKTIKGCAWFGDNFVLSGSDDGHIYGWDLNSEHIVCFLEGDVKGVVNYLSVHPNLPVLASSGLDHNVKVWEPISKTWPQTLKGIKPQICKNTMRRKRALERRNQVFRPRDEDDEDEYEEVVRLEEEEDHGFMVSVPASSRNHELFWDDSRRLNSISRDHDRNNIM